MTTSCKMPSRNAEQTHTKELHTLTHTNLLKNNPGSVTKLILGSWAREGTSEASMEIDSKNVIYLNDEGGPVPYKLIGDSVFFESKDFNDHYLLSFIGNDIMSMTDTVGTTTFHRVTK